MSYTHERDEFVARMTREGVSLATIRGLLRHASTLQRLAVAACNGDYPADNGQRSIQTCPECEGGWVPESFRAAPRSGLHQKVCPDCYTAHKVRSLVPGAWRPIFGGDPRGAVLRLVPREATAEDVDSGRERGIYVPARE